jgi:hypothetical protein
VGLQVLTDQVPVAKLSGVRMLIGMAPFSGMDVGRNGGDALHRGSTYGTARCATPVN